MNNSVHDVPLDTHGAKGASLFDCKRCLFEGNAWYNLAEGSFDKQGAESNVWRRNVFRNFTLRALDLNNQPDHAGVWNIGTRVSENVFDCSGGSGPQPVLVRNGAVNATINSNTMYRCGALNSRCGDKACTGLRLRSNLWASTPAQLVYDFEGPPGNIPVESDYNLFGAGSIYEVEHYTQAARTYTGLAAWQGGVARDARSIEAADPLFVDAAASDLWNRGVSPQTDVQSVCGPDVHPVVATPEPPECPRPLR